MAVSEQDLLLGTLTRERLVSALLIQPSPEHASTGVHKFLRKLTELN